MPLFFGTDYDVKLEVRFPIHDSRCCLSMHSSLSQDVSPKITHGNTRLSLQGTM